MSTTILRGLSSPCTPRRCRRVWHEVRPLYRCLRQTATSGQTLSWCTHCENRTASISTSAALKRPTPASSKCSRWLSVVMQFITVLFWTLECTYKTGRMWCMVDVIYTFSDLTIWFVHRRAFNLACRESCCSTLQSRFILYGDLWGSSNSWRWRWELL